MSETSSQFEWLGWTAEVQDLLRCRLSQCEQDQTLNESSKSDRDSASGSYGLFSE